MDRLSPHEKQKLQYYVNKARNRSLRKDFLEQEEFQQLALEMRDRGLTGGHWDLLDPADKFKVNMFGIFPNDLMLWIEKIQLHAALVNGVLHILRLHVLSREVRQELKEVVRIHKGFFFATMQYILEFSGLDAFSLDYAVQRTQLLDPPEVELSEIFTTRY